MSIQPNFPPIYLTQMVKVDDPKRPGLAAENIGTNYLMFPINDPNSDFVKGLAVKAQWAAIDKKTNEVKIDGEKKGTKENYFNYFMDLKTFG